MPHCSRDGGIKITYNNNYCLKSLAQFMRHACHMYYDNNKMRRYSKNRDDDIMYACSYVNQRI